MEGFHWDTALVVEDDCEDYGRVTFPRPRPDWRMASRGRRDTTRRGASHHQPEKGQRKGTTSMGKPLKPTAPDRDNPEWTKDDITRARPAADIPALARATRGRPVLPEEKKKQRVTLYLDRDVVGQLKKDGRGWQTRANARLREALGL